MMFFIDHIYISFHFLVFNFLRIPAGVVESLAHYKKEFEDTDISLQALLNDCHNKIGLIRCKFHSTIYIYTHTIGIK